jgi:hypothetical protein
MKPRMSEHNTHLQRTHQVRQPAGRDPGEHGRTAASRELLYDLVFVVTFGQAANQFAHLLSEGHVPASIGGFVFAMFAVIWAWMNFSWFSSAFDTDDWVHRIATMVQMEGVTILALGLPAVFHSLDSAHGVDIGVVVAGYVVMRVAMVFLWLRAAKHSPLYRSTCMTHVLTIVIAQIGWVAVALLPLPLVHAAGICLVLVLVELLGPYLAATRHGGTPWHAHPYRRAIRPVELTIRVAVHPFGIFKLHGALNAEVHPVHMPLLALTALVLASAPLLAHAGVSVPVRLLVVTAAPAVSVIGYETYGRGHGADALKPAAEP